MKSITDPSTSTTTNIEDRRAFTIQATGKAFRTLIDGIYSNKILAPVRELMTNAYDGHLARGNTDRPFQVHVPSGNEPWFAVRDFGEGMPHETVMGLYTTLFDSSKDQTNDQVGKFGLGSKSPFAYADTFTVTCYDGEEKRVYNAHMDDDIPQLGLLYREHSTEEQGVEVQFPVSPFDANKFTAAIQRVLLGFDVQPEVLNSARLEVREPIDQGVGYRVYKALYSYDEYLSPVNVRQGCVVYPVQDLGGTEFAGVSIPHGSRFVVDIPIGTSEITTNREQLADDETSVANVVPYLDNAFINHKLRSMQRYEAATSRLEQCEVLAEIDYEWRRAFDLPLRLEVNLYDFDWDTEKRNEMVGKPGHFVLDALKVKEHKSEFNYDVLKEFSFILDQEGVTRRRGRTTTAVKTAEGVYLGEDDDKKWHRFHGEGRVFVVPVEGQRQTVKRLKSLCGFQDSQFVSVADLPDPGTNKVKSAGSQTSKRYLKELLDSGMPWANRMRGKVSTSLYRYHVENFDNVWILDALGVDQDILDEVKDVWGDQRQTTWDSEVVVPLSDAQIAALEPDPEMEVSNVIKRAFAASGIEEQVREQVFVAQLHNDLNMRLVDARGDLARAILVAEGLDLNFEWDVRTKKAMYMHHGVSQIRDLVIGRRYYSRMNQAEEYFKADEDEINEAIDALQRKYPALFTMDNDAIYKYIEEVNAS